MPKSRPQLRRILKRDRICGRHIDGCGKAFHTPKEATVGHLIPRSLYETFDQERSTNFAGDWNVQPECAVCNNERGGQVDSWPLFTCKCHWLWVDEVGPTTRAIHVVESLQGSANKHKLHEWSIDNPPSGDTKWVFETDATMILAKIPPGGGKIGWSKAPAAGHILIPIPEFAIPIFNWLEHVRTDSSASPAWTLRQSGDLVTRELRCQDGRVLLSENGKVKRVLPRDEGFRNLASFGVRLTTP